MRQLKIATQITNRDSQAVEKYLQEISKIPMITPEEETVLAQRIKMGDQKALDKLVQANLRFVVSVAKQYQHQGLSLSDLINEGNLGLIKAAQRFDETKGFKFISYAVWWIRQSILQALAEQGRLVRLPQNKIGTYNKANKAYMAFEQEHEREPSTEELAELLEMSETEINNIFQSNTRHSSLDAPVHEAEDVAMGDLLEGGDETDDDVMKDSFTRRDPPGAEITQPPRSGDRQRLFRSGRRKWGNHRADRPEVRPDERAYPPDQGKGDQTPSKGAL